MAVKKRVAKKKTVKRVTKEVSSATSKALQQSAITRAGLNRAQRHEEMRQKISGSSRVNVINGLYDDASGLRKRAREIANFVESDVEHYHTQLVYIEKESIKLEHDLIKTQLDVQYRMLAKVLPDEKQLELIDPNGNNPFDKFVGAFKDLVKGAS